MKPLRILILILILPVLIGAHCASPDPWPTNPEDFEDTHLCDEAEAKLLDLGCPEGDPITDKEGHVQTFTAWCVASQEAGSKVNPSCIVNTLKTCDDLYGVCGQGLERPHP